jgi:UDP-GlcNAc:undecaprenyl-phosphate GlcNAc-1-phosphate transferase
MAPLVALAVGFLITFATTPLTSRLAVRFGVLDRADQPASTYKQHSSDTPYLGGIAMLMGLLAGTVLLITIPAGGSVVTSKSFILGILIAAGIGIVGLIDDIRQLPRWLRLALEVAAAAAAWAAGFRVLFSTMTPVNFLVTILWIVGITNAFNLLDNMDGLSSGLAGIGALSFAALGMVEGLSIVPIVAGALAGACIGFLVHNRYPAKVFMGDSGSLFIGFLMALLGIQLRFDNLVEITFLVPVVVLGVPIFDTTLVVLSRWRRGVPVFSGGRDHVSHRLVAIGLPPKAAVGLLYWAALCLGWLGLVISRSNKEVAWMLLGLVIALAIFFGFVLWKVPLSDPAQAEPAGSAGN